jgi:hypothetical protein
MTMAIPQMVNRPARPREGLGANALPRRAHEIHRASTEKSPRSVRADPTRGGTRRQRRISVNDTASLGEQSGTSAEMRAEFIARCAKGKVVLFCRRDFQFCCSRPPPRWPCPDHPSWRVHRYPACVAHRNPEPAPSRWRRRWPRRPRARPGDRASSPPTRSGRWDWR